MVRLRASYVVHIAMPSPFQFQYGTIESENLMQSGLNTAAFQFQYGTIESDEV